MIKEVGLKHVQLTLRLVKMNFLFGSSSVFLVLVFKCFIEMFVMFLGVFSFDRLFLFIARSLSNLKKRNYYRVVMLEF